MASSAVLVHDAGEPPGAAHRPPRRAAQAVLRSGWWQIAILALLYGGYSLTRSLADDSFQRAADTALSLWDVESLIGLDVEAAFNQAVADVRWVSVAMSFWYASLHFIVTGGVLWWIFRRRRASYPGLRNALVGATTLALGLYLLLPTAPPRLLGHPFQDVLMLTDSVGWWGHGGAAPTGVANELAAFPSMHAGWALWVAVALWRVAPRPVAWVGVAYATCTAVVVVGTGNHWVIDVVAGWAVVMFAVWAAHRPRSRGRHVAATERAPA